jgi:hypothetical protein
VIQTFFYSGTAICHGRTKWSIHQWAKEIHGMAQQSQKNYWKSIFMKPSELKAETYHIEL